MFNKNKLIFLGGAVVLVVWGALYSMLVSPNWSERDLVKVEAQAQLDKWSKYYKKKKGSIKLVVAKENLGIEDEVLRVSLERLRQIECSDDLGRFTLASVGGGDSNNYFDKQCREVVKNATGSLGMKLAAGLENHLGFQGKLKTDPVALKLTRLYMIHRFFQAANRAGIKHIIKIDYPKVVAKELIAKGAADDEDESEPERIDRIFEIPLVIRIHAQEPNLAQLLCELQLPSNKTRSYFCLRGISVEVREDVQGKVEAQIALGGIFSDKQYLETLKIPFEEKKRGPAYISGPSINSRDY